MDVRDSTELTTSVKAKRFAAQTLVDLSLKSIVAANTRMYCLVDALYKQIRALPNDLVQRVFLFLSEQETRPVDIRSINLRDRPLIFLLLNKQAEEFGLQSIVNAEFPHLKTAVPCDWVLDHALKGCPEFKKAFLDLSPASGCIPSGAASLGPKLLSMSRKWKNLRLLSLTGKDVMDDRIFGLIGTHLPRLEGLNIEDTTEKPLVHFTERSVASLALMKKLKVLGFRLVEQFAQFGDPIWPQIAGRVPNLERLQMDGISSSFISHFKKFYPDKSLVLEYFRLDSKGQSTDVVQWPRNVSVEVLTLEGQVSMENLHMIPQGVRKLVICGAITPQEVTHYVEFFGQSITTLKMDTTHHFLSVLPLLDVCPRVEQVSINHEGALERNSSNSVLSPEWFSKLKEFKVKGSNGDWEEETFLTKVLLGSQHSCSDPILYVDSAVKMRTILQVLEQTNSSCKFLSRLEKVVISRGDNELLPFFEECFEVAYRLIENSPLRLKRISLNIERMDQAEFSTHEVEQQVARLRQVAEELSIHCIITP